MSSEAGTARVAFGRFLRWGIIVFCLVYAFWGFDPARFMDIVSGYTLPAVFFAVSITFIGYFVLGGRLLSLAGSEMRFADCLTGTIIGQGVNNILPAKLGEAVKAMYLARENGRSTAWVFGLVFWERFLDLNALMLLGLAIVVSVKSPLTMGAFSAIVILIWLTLAGIRLWPGCTRALVRLVPFEKLKEFLGELADHLVEGLGMPVILRASLWTLLIWVLYVAQVAFILLFAAQLDLDITGVLVIFIVSGIGMNLAASPGGLGVYEAAIVASASWFGVARDEALAAAVVLHVIQYVPSTVLGLLLMSRVNLSFRQVRDRT